MPNTTQATQPSPFHACKQAVLDTRSRYSSAVHLPVVPQDIEQPSLIRSISPTVLHPRQVTDADAP